MAADINSIIRNKIRDLIGSKNWSVSRFAARYVEAFADKYSRMEAPSTSTARKLVEEEGHIYSEREVIVLDSFTQLDFYHMWLDGQKAELIERTNRYLGTNSAETSIDSPAMLHDSIAKLNRKGVHITLDDIEHLINRFEALDTALPMILASPARPLIHAVLQNISPLINIINIHPANVIEGIKSLIANSAQGQKYIGCVYCDSYHRSPAIAEVFGKDIFLLKFGWSKPMEESYRRKCVEPERKKRIGTYAKARKCLSVREDWPDLFKRMIEACLNSQWVELPDDKYSGQWMLFLESIYQQLKPALVPGPLYNALENLTDMGIPELWLTEHCDPISLLQCIVEFEQWKREKEQSIAASENKTVANRQLDALKHFEDTDYAELMLLGNTKEIERADWRQWFEQRFLFFLVDFDFNKLLELDHTLNLLHKK